MAAGPIRFRCSQCQRLLGASPAKAGTVVSCPRCSAENFVPFEDQSLPAPPPRPAPAPAGLAPQVESGAVADGPRESVSGIDPELLSIRPEDIRVEPGVRNATPPLSPAVSATTPDPSQESDEPDPEPDEGYSIEEEVPPPLPPPVAVPPARTRATPAGPVQNAVERAPDSTAAEPIVPPIRIDEPLRQARSPQPVILRPRDLIVPRSLVATWSILVLLAVGFAFVSGLLIGHYVWGVH